MYFRSANSRRIKPGVHKFTLAGGATSPYVRTLYAHFVSTVTSLASLMDVLMVGETAPFGEDC
jgi:hypothetical protein